MKKENNGPQPACHYVTFNTVDWVDVFIRPVYKQILVEALNYFINQRRVTLYGWCLMTNHLHMLVQAKDGTGLAQVEKEFKKLTTTRILESIAVEPDLRRDWMLQRFEHFSKSLGKSEKYSLWQSCSNPVFIDFKQVFKLQERLLYIHENPVRDRIVENPEDYLYSSAAQYAGKPGLVKTTLIDFNALRMAVLKPGKEE